MVVASPVGALGPHAGDVSSLIVQAVRNLHARFADAHQASGSRYAMCFGSQWRDLLDDVREALNGRGYRTYKLPPAGYRLPVVNDCLVFVRRVGGVNDSAANFASSPTRVNGFSAPMLDPTLFEPGLTGDLEPVATVEEQTELDHALQEMDPFMTLVLVTVHSSPSQLQMIEWAVAERDDKTGEVRLHGQEKIWQPEASTGRPATDVESFDSGFPRGPVLEPREQEGTDPDAR